MEEKTSWVDRVKQGPANVVVVGGGYVGLPLAMAVAGVECPVTVLDSDPERVKQINEGRSHTADVPSEHVALARAWGQLRATQDPSEALARADVIIVCVPTPLQLAGTPDMRYVEDVIDSVERFASAPYLLVIESTVYPGYTERVRQRLATRSGVFVAFSPERIDPGNRKFMLKNTPKVIGGSTGRAHDLASAFYSRFVEKVVPVSCPTTAETVKLLENTYRAVNIALANEFALACRVLGVDVWEVIRAASTKPFGFTPFYPGPGVGGHCIGPDPQYLAWRLHELGQHARLTELAAEINASMPQHVVNRIIEELNERGRAVRGAKVLVVGIAYKPGVGDTRESPALHIIDKLMRLGALIQYVDPFVAALPEFELTSISAKGPFDGNDLAVIVTPHESIDYGLLLEQVPIIVDTRGKLEGTHGPCQVVTL